MSRVSPTRSPIRKWIALVGLITIICSSLVVPPTSVQAAQTVQCHDGSIRGTDGYTQDSECARLMARYDCIHSDNPTGAQDTLTCTDYEQCLSYNTTVQFDKSIREGEPSAELAYSVQFFQSVCFDGNLVWFDDNPFHRTFVPPGMSRQVTVADCTNTSSPIGVKFGTYAISQCATNVAFDFFGPMRAEFIPRHAMNNNSNFVLWDGQNTNRFYTFRVSPQGCITISGIGRSGPVYCYPGL